MLILKLLTWYGEHKGHMLDITCCKLFFCHRVQYFDNCLEWSAWLWCSCIKCSFNIYKIKFIHLWENQEQKLDFKAQINASCWKEIVKQFALLASLPYPLLRGVGGIGIQYCEFSDMATLLCTAEIRISVNHILSGTELIIAFWHIPQKTSIIEWSVTLIIIKMLWLSRSAKTTK